MWEQLQDPDKALTPHLIFWEPDMGGGDTVLSFRLAKLGKDGSSVLFPDYGN